jgi:hypothetical protein
MRTFKGFLTSGAAIAALAIAAVPANAAPVVIGSNLENAMVPTNQNCNNACTTTNATLIPASTAPGGLTSPVDGVVTSWTAKGSSNAALRILTPGVGFSYTGGGTSPLVNLTGAGTTTALNPALPIKAGDGIGLDIPNGSLSVASNAGASQIYWNVGGGGPLGIGETRVGAPGGAWETLVQATVQPKPVVTLTATSAKQKVGKASVAVSSTEAATATITTAIQGVKGTKVVTAPLTAGTPATVRLGLTGKLKKKIVKKLKKKKKRTATVTAETRDPFGQTVTSVVTFKVKK